jgi:hypothetical protein
VSIAGLGGGVNFGAGGGVFSDRRSHRDFRQRAMRRPTMITADRSASHVGRTLQRTGPSRHAGAVRGGPAAEGTAGRSSSTTLLAARNPPSGHDGNPRPVKVLVSVGLGRTFGLVSKIVSQTSPRNGHEPQTSRARFRRMGCDLALWPARWRCAVGVTGFETTASSLPRATSAPFQDRAGGG